jgi:GTP-binding protein
VLVHVVDCATFEPGRDPVSDVVALEDELARYTGVLGGVLASRPRLIALNKIDVPDARDLAELVRGDLVQRFGWPVFEISTATRAGLRELAFAMAEEVRAARAALPAVEPTRVVLRPAAVDDTGFTVTPDPDLPGGFVVRGERPERWIRQTNFDNDEAVGYLGDRLARLGVEEALADAGAVPGCPVTIGDVTFDWEPSTPAGVAVMLSGRGTDRRLEQSSRARAAERLAARVERRRSRNEEELLDGASVQDGPAQDGPAQDGPAQDEA